MKRSIKLALLAGVRALGGFRVSRWLTRKRIRVLCYHGIAVMDEHRFRPALFMRETTLRGRLKALRNGRYDVISLEEAVARIEQGRPPQRASVVITIDDGFRHTAERALPLLREYGMPATVYVTSYYAARPCPIPTLAVQYMLWRSERSTVDLAAIVGESDAPAIDLGNRKSASAAADRLVSALRSMTSEADRQRLLDRLGEALGVPAQPMREDGRLCLMDADAVRQAAQAGTDIQLHTHRHVLPLDADGVRRELDDNRAFLEPLVGRRLEHFCYPSGDWDPRHWPLLEACGIRSATTCVPGLNAVDAPPLALSRFVDQDDVHPLEFEAEISGFAAVPRALKRVPSILRGEKQSMN